MGDEITKFLEGVTGVVEANNFEMACLWQNFHQTKKWESNLSGYGKTVGQIGDMPVAISLQTAVVDGQKLLFYYATSQVVDHRMIEAWLEKTIPDGWTNRADARNFHNVLRRAA